MSKKPVRCAFCFEILPYGIPGQFRITLSSLADEKIVLAWHIEPCLGKDELHDTLATALSKPDSPENDREVIRAWTAIRIRARDAGYVHEVVDVRKDVNIPGYTLRDPKAWGLVSPRKRGKVKS